MAKYHDPNRPSVSEELILEALKKGPKTAIQLECILAANPYFKTRPRGHSAKLLCVFLHRLRKKGFLIKNHKPRTHRALYELLPAGEENTCKAAPP